MTKKHVFYIVLIFFSSCSEKPNNKFDFSNSAQLNNSDPASFTNSNYTLEGVTNSHPEDSGQSDLQNRLNELRRQKSEVILDEISTVEERIDFGDVFLEVQSDNTIKISFNTILESSGEKEPMIYLSTETEENGLVYFKNQSGQSIHEVGVRGFCFSKSDEGVCTNIVIEISYVLNDNVVIRQFKFKQEVTELEEEVVEAEAEAEVIEEEKNIVVVVDSTQTKEAIEKTEILVEDEPVKIEEEIKEEIEEVVEETVSAPEVLETDPDPESESDIKITSEEIKEETSSLAPVKSVRPKARPTSDSAPQTSLRPKARPVSLIEVDEDNQEDVEELGYGAGLFILPDKTKISDTPNRLVFRDIGEVSLSYADLDADDFPVYSEESVSSKDLEAIKTTVFNQSRGLYYESSGRIVNDDQISNEVRGLHVGPDHRRIEQYASGLTKGVLEWSVEKFNESYPNSPVCVNDVSKKGGGKLSGHKSHRNGLDIDISIPSTENNCTGGRRFKDFSELLSDRGFLEKNWEFLKLLNSTNRIHVVFVDRNFIKRICQHTKTIDLNSEELSQRDEIFKRLHHIGGHRNHYHIRLKCNEQNVGCQTQGELRGSSCK